MAITIKINSSFVDPLLETLDIQFILNGRSTAKCSIFDRDNSIALTVGQLFEVFDDATKIFAGTLDGIDTTLADGTTKVQHDLTVVGFERYLDKRLSYDTITLEVPVYKSYSGTVDVAGATVTWKSGDYFDTELQSRALVINGNSYTCATVDSPVSLTLGSSAGTQTGVAYTFTWTAGAIVTDLVTRFLGSEGITLGTINAGANVTKAIYDHEIFDDVFDQLAQLSGYIWWVDINKAVQFVARNTVTAPFNITDSSRIITAQNVTVQTTRQDYRNMECVRSSPQALAPRTQAFAGDGVSRAWQLSVGTPLVGAGRVGSIVSIELNGTPMSFGVANVDSGREFDFYYAPGERIIQQDAAASVLMPSDTLTVNFYEIGQDVISYADHVEVAERAAIEPDSSGLYQHLTDNSKNTDPQASLGQAVSLVDRYKAMPTLLTYQTNTALEPSANLLMTGQLQGVVLSKLNKNATYLISQLQITSKGSLREGDEWVLWYIVTAVTGTYLSNYLTVFESFAGGAASSSLAVTVDAGSPTMNGTIAYA